MSMQVFITGGTGDHRGGCHQGAAPRRARGGGPFAQRCLGRKAQGARRDAAPGRARPVRELPEVRRGARRALAHRLRLRLRRHRDWLHQASGMFVHAGYPTLEAVNRAEAQLYTIVNQQSSLLSISTAVSVWWCQAWLRWPWRCVSRISNPPQKPTGAH